MKTRPFFKDDIPACAALFLNVFNREPWNDQWTIQLAVEYIEDVMNTPGFVGLVMEDSRKREIIGFVIGARKKWWNGDIFYLYEMCVGQAYQGKGIGKQLMEDTKTSLFQNGFSAIVLLTERTFPSAHFYEKQGFIESPDTRFYYCGL